VGAPYALPSSLFAIQLTGSARGSLYRPARHSRWVHFASVLRTAWLYLTRPGLLVGVASQFFPSMISKPQYYIPVGVVCELTGSALSWADL
jgi:hypothetical protein